MTFTLPTVQQFKDHFFRDFPYADDDARDDLGKVTDRDIEKAMVEAGQNFNKALFGNQESFALAFLYATAHYLVCDLTAAASGVSGRYTWLTTSRAVGSVSESYEIPQSVRDNPTLSYFASTPYGAKYLGIITPLLIGNVMAFQGTTWP